MGQQKTFLLLFLDETDQMIKYGILLNIGWQDESLSKNTEAYQ